MGLGGRHDLPVCHGDDLTDPKRVAFLTLLGTGGAGEVGEERLGCSMASITENRFLLGPGWSVEPEEAPRLKKPTVGGHPTQTLCH